MSFAEQCLDLHNKYRALHSAAPLKLDDKLIAKAEELVEIPRKGGAIFQKYYRPTYNINEFYINLRNDKAILQAETVIDYWYNTKIKHNFRDNNPSNLAGRFFTQIVWKNTTHFGIAAVTSGDGKWWAVGVYYPPGNIEGQYLENVDNILVPPPPRIEPQVRPMTPEQKEKFDKLVAEYEAKKKRIEAAKKESTCANFMCCKPLATKKR